MFGIGVGEFVVVALVLLMAVGPDKMPTLFKTVGKALRMFRRTTRELKNSIGLDELLRDDDQRRLKRPAYTPPPRKEPERYTLTAEDMAAEEPPAGVDFADARSRRESASDAAGSRVPGAAVAGAATVASDEDGGGEEGDYEDEELEETVESSPPRAVSEEV